MCEFVSWVKTQELDKQGNPKIFFLTGKQVFHSDKGKKLQEWAESRGDLKGHGAIRFFYGLEQDQGENKECTNFSTPDNFPSVIVRAIKRGDMRGFCSGQMLELFTKEALKAYAEREKADAEWEKADAEWEKADAEREKAYAEWEKADAEWEKAYAEWEKADAEREKAYAEWEKADEKHGYLWDLFAIPENRVKAWR